MESNEDERHTPLTSFEKYGETKDILDSLLAAPLNVEPTTEEDREESDRLQNLDDIVSRTFVGVIRLTDTNTAIWVPRAALSPRSASRNIYCTRCPGVAPPCANVYIAH